MASAADQIFHWRLDQLFRGRGAPPDRRTAHHPAREDRCDRRDDISPSRQHVDELHAHMPEIGIGKRILLERDEKRLDARS
jgi:hypothetical protein